MRVFHAHIGLAQIQHAAIAVIEGGGQIGCQLLLQHQPHAAGIQFFAAIGKRSRIKVGQNVAAIAGQIAHAGQCRVNHAVREHRHLHARFSHAACHGNFVVVRFLQPRREAGKAHAGPGLA